MATSSFQVEGAWNADGKGESIWDRFSHTPGKIQDGSTADVACDQYHRYKEDIAILKRLNQKSYRFSTSWPRIQPAGTGPANPKGLDYYSRLVDALLEAGIRPFCTIYHWELPQALEDRGGWPNRDLAGYYADFAAILARNLGDRITIWAPFNMPSTFTYFGYGTGWDPPGRTGFDQFLKAAHTVNLAQGEAFRAIKAVSSRATVGSAYGMEPVYPKTDSAADRAAAARFHAFHNLYFLDPAMRGEYPAAFDGEACSDASLLLSILNSKATPLPASSLLKSLNISSKSEPSLSDFVSTDMDLYLPSLPSIILIRFPRPVVSMCMSIIFRSPPILPIILLDMSAMLE